MAFRSRRALPARIAAALLIACLGERCGAEEAWRRPRRRRPRPRRHTPRARRAESARGAAARDACRAEQHRLPPDSTTKQSAGSARPFARLHRNGRFDPPVRRQGRGAGRHRLHLLSAGRCRSRHAPGHVCLQRRPGRVVGLAAIRQQRSLAPGDHRATATPSDTPDVQPNAETWLDFTDLVYIDPVGTGYSRFVASGDDVRKRFFSVDGDVSSIAVVIRRWLEKHDRLTSPKFIAGESYGGIRGPKIVRNLQTEQGVGVRGLILISPVLDFREYSGSSILQYVASLPSMRLWRGRPSSGPVTPRRSCRCRALCARRFSGRSHQG